MRAQGDAIKAEQLLDCSYFEYYWRVVLYNIYCDKVKEANTKK